MVAQLVVHRVTGHEPSLEAAGATDVVELNVATFVAQGSCDGQRGVDVPAGPAARHRNRIAQ